MVSKLIVGPTGPFRTIAEAVARASAHDEILVAPATYYDEVITVNKSLSIGGFGGTPILRARHVLTDARGVITTNADTCLSNIEIQVAHGLTGNGSGIWHENGRLSVRRCVFRGNQNGILAAKNPCSTVKVMQSTFANNGGGCGHTRDLRCRRDRRAVSRGMQLPRHACRASHQEQGPPDPGCAQLSRRWPHGYHERFSVLRLWWRIASAWESDGEGAQLRKLEVCLLWGRGHALPDEPFGAARESVYQPPTATDHWLGELRGRCPGASRRQRVRTGFCWRFGTREGKSEPACR